MKKKPLYQTIFQDYKKKINSGELAVGDKLPTEMDISLQYHVSRITATRALRELELKGLIYRVKGSGSYVCDKEVEEIKSENRVPIISLVVPFGGELSMQYLQGVEEVAKEQGYFVTYHNSNSNQKEERELIEDLIQRGSSGVIVYPTSTAHNLDLYSGLMIDNYPFVLIDHRIPGIDLPLVWTNNYDSFYNVTTHLLKLNHKNIVFVGYDIYRISSEFERYKGFCKAHLDHDVALLEKNLFNVQDEVLEIDYHSEESYEERLAHKLFDELEKTEGEDKVTAIAAVNDEIASVLISVAIKKGINIPNDYSITGFDNSPIITHLPVQLTTIVQPARQIGNNAANELIATINNPEREVAIISVDGELIVRDSTKKV